MCYGGDPSVISCGQPPSNPFTITPLPSLSMHKEMNRTRRSLVRIRVSEGLPSCEVLPVVGSSIRHRASNPRGRLKSRLKCRCTKPLKKRCSSTFNRLIEYSPSGFVNRLFNRLSGTRAVHNRSPAGRLAFTRSSNYRFRTSDKQTYQMWVNNINSYLSLERNQPKNILACSITSYRRVGPASDAMASITNWEVAIIELFIRLRPLDEDSIVETESDVLLHVVYPMVSNEDESPLLKRSTLDESQDINLRIDFSSVELGAGSDDIGAANYLGLLGKNVKWYVRS
ncbi:hypothetical protein R6Q59_007752 [Mikania micrantha]